MGENYLDISEMNCKSHLDVVTGCDNSPGCENQQTAIKESKPSMLLDELRTIYEDSLAEIDENASKDAMQHKLKVLSSWVSNLSEQNTILINTIEQVEQEAVDRVALLEDKLHKSSQIAVDYSSKFQNYNNYTFENEKREDQSNHLRSVATVTLGNAECQEDILKKRISNLQNDISGLLEIIRRARCYGSWDASGLNFLELTYEDIFG